MRILFDLILDEVCRKLVLNESRICNMLVPKPKGITILEIETVFVLNKITNTSCSDSSHHNITSSWDTIFLLI